jgi:hypothetical protein
MNAIVRFIGSVIVIMGLVGCAGSVDMTKQDRSFIRNARAPEITFLVEDKELEGSGPAGGGMTIRLDSYAETARALINAYTGKSISIYSTKETPVYLNGKVVNIVPMAYHCKKPWDRMHYQCIYKATANGVELEGDSVCPFPRSLDKNDVLTMTPKAFASWATRVKEQLSK